MHVFFLTKRPAAVTNPPMPSSLRLTDRRLALALGLALAVAAALWSASSASATVLCKTSGSPCSGGTYGKGTIIEASLKTGTSWVLTADKTRSCEESTIKGEVTGAGGTPGVPVTGTVTSMKVGKCSSSVEVTKNGTFSITSSAGGTVLTLEGFEINAGGGLCYYGGPAATSLTPGAMASISASAALPKVSGSGTCPATAGWSAQYTVTAPEPLYVPSEPAATVLCKTASNPCSAGNAYGKGSALKLELKEGTLFTFGTPSPYVGCTKVVIEGEVTTSPGGGVDVGGPLKEFSFGGCSHDVTVLKKGSFSVDYVSGNSGTLTLKEFEINDGSLCSKWTGPAALPLTGGAMASAAIKGFVPGCYEGFTWTAEFTVVKPEPLYVSEL
jgi:hypothetical protein